MTSLRLFSFATLAPIGLIGLGVGLGNPWPWLALGYMTVLVFLLDRLIARTAQNTNPEAEFPGANALLITLGLAHFIVFGAGFWAVIGSSGLSMFSTVILLLAIGLVLGQISHPVAHELIHQQGRFQRALGRIIYTSLLVGHHASAHLRVHHVHVGSDADPNTARLGEGFYHYAIRASYGSFCAGLTAENRLRAGRKFAPWAHPYMLYAGGAVTMVTAGYVFGNLAGVVTVLALCTYAQLQILMSDYVQHYGLRRALLPNGRLEPVGPQHSWNTPHWYSSALMLNAPRHSDHHTTPNRAFPALRLDANSMPMLPFPLPFMASIALLPPLWRRMMDHRCDKWRGQLPNQNPLEPTPAP